jgi:Ca2+/Na+ antiporter
VTLLALGNGAPDVFAAIAAGGDEAGLNLQVASLIGSSFFVVAVVMALSLNAGNNRAIQVTRNYFIRDVIFLLITCVYLLIIMLAFEEFNLYISLGFVFIYLVFVATVVIQSKFYNNVEEGEEEILEQTMRAQDYSSLIAFKRQEYKKGAALDDFQVAGVTIPYVPSAFQSTYSKKVPKDILELNDEVSAKYFKKQETYLSSQFKLQKQKTMGFLKPEEQEVDFSHKPRGPRGSSSHYQKSTKQPFQYEAADVVDVQQLHDKHDGVSQKVGPQVEVS